MPFINNIDDDLSISLEPECWWNASVFLSNEPLHDKNNKMTCAPSKDLDRPWHPPSLIRAFAVCSMGSYGPNASSSYGQRVFAGRRNVILLVWAYCRSFNVKEWQQIIMNLPGIDELNVLDISHIHLKVLSAENTSFKNIKSLWHQ